MSLTVYGPSTNYRVLLCLALAEHAGVKVEHKVISYNETKSPEFLKKNPLGQVPVLETPEGCLYQTNAIIRHIARLGKGLYGASNVETSHIDQWLDFLSCDIIPAVTALSGPILGWFPLDTANEKKSRDDLTKFLTVLNNHLNGKKFIVGDHTSVADLAYSVFLSIALRTCLGEKERAQFSHVTAFVLAQFENKSLQSQFGRVTAAHFPKVPLPFATVHQPATWSAPAAPAAPAAAKKEEKKDAAPKGGDKKKEEKPKTAAPPAAKKEDKPKPAPAPKKEAAADEDDEEKPKKKEKNELDLLPETKFNMVDWKLRFVNSTDRAAEMKWFWENIDKEGWSLWDVYYEKFGSEGQKLWLTCNLKNGYLQRFDEFRKYVFGTYGVYGEEPKLETKGIWFFRGQTIPFILADIPGTENHQLTKLDWNNPEHRKRTEEAWLALGKDEQAVVDGLRAREVTNLR